MKAAFGKKLPLRLCLATQAAGQLAFDLEGFPEAEREIELRRIFAGAELVTLGEGEELRWEERRGNHEAWLAGIAREKGLASVRALLLQK